MSYGRIPHYIWSDARETEGSLHFGWLDEAVIPNEQINAFLYKILLTGRREELANRLRQGKSIWISMDEQSNSRILEEEDEVLQQLLKDKNN